MFSEIRNFLVEKFALNYIASLGLQSNIATLVSGLQCKYQGFNSVISLLKSWKNMLMLKDLKM